MECYRTISLTTYLCEMFKCAQCINKISALNYNRMKITYYWSKGFYYLFNLCLFVQDGNRDVRVGYSSRLYVRATYLQNI